MALGYQMAEVKSAESGTRTSAVLAGLILGVGLFIIAVSLYTVVVTYSSLPFLDQWGEVTYAANGGNLFSPSWLWERWFEHRLVIPKLFEAADLKWFHGRQIFLLSTIFVIQLLHLALLSWSMRRLGGWRGALWLTGTGMAAFCLFYPSQWENFVWGFQVCFVLAQLLATLSFAMLLLYSDGVARHGRQACSWFLVFSILAALGSNYSLANGNLLWPLLVAAALYLRLPRAAIGSLAGVGVMSTGLYFHHYLHSASGHPIFSNLHAPLRMFSFSLEYLFGTWIHHGIYVAVLIVMAELAVAAGVIFLARLYLRNFQNFGVQLVLMMIFWVAMAALTAAGRSSLGTVGARASRYQTVILLVWCCVGLLLLGCAFFARPRMPQAFAAAQIFLLLVFVAGAAAVRYPIAEARQHGFMLNAAEASLHTGVYDQEQLRQIYLFIPDLDLPELDRGLRYLHANKLSTFARELSPPLGKRIEYSFPAISYSDCTGALDSIVTIDTPGGTGLRLTGWAWDTGRQRPASSVIVTINGTVRGYGAVGEWHSAVRDGESAVANGYMGFVAYAPKPLRGSGLTVYAVLRRSQPTVCFLTMK